VNLDMCFSGGWMSLHIPRASENGFTSVPPEELPSVWWRDNQHIHPSNTQRIGILAQQKHYTQVQISHLFSQSWELLLLFITLKASCLHGALQGSGKKEIYSQWCLWYNMTMTCSNFCRIRALAWSDVDEIKIVN
jgi:hypothetical protein